MVATTWPVMTAPRETSMTLNRLMMPFVMSELTSAVAETVATASRIIPASRSRCT